MANRTRKGNVTAKARKKHGKKFPVFDHKSAMSAIRLRGHGNKKKVLNKVSRWASTHNDATVKNAVSRARKRDRKRG